MNYIDLKKKLYGWNGQKSLSEIMTVDDITLMADLIEAFSELHDADAECYRYDRSGYEGRFETACDEREEIKAKLDTKMEEFLQIVMERNDD